MDSKLKQKVEKLLIGGKLSTYIGRGMKPTPNPKRFIDHKNCVMILIICRILPIFKECSSTIIVHRMAAHAVHIYQSWALLQYARL